MVTVIPLSLIYDKQQTKGKRQCQSCYGMVLSKMVKL